MEKYDTLLRENKSKENDIFKDPYFALTLRSKINNREEVSRSSHIFAWQVQ